MKRRRVTDPEQLERALSGCRERVRRFDGVLFRSVALEHASSAAITTGAGARRFGGRWNPPGAFAAFYGSLDPETAMAEMLAQFRYYGWPAQAALPRLFVAVRVRLARVLDLTQATVLRRLRVELRQLCEHDWRRDQDRGLVALTQAIGQAAFNAGLTGLLVPSAARPEGRNLVAFPGVFKRRDELELLPPDVRSTREEET